jgi:hypothetical protein
VAENDDELTLTVGDTISVLQTSLEDAGWWKGELNGKIGVFPDNFVELLPAVSCNDKVRQLHVRCQSLSKLGLSQENYS